MPNIKPFSDLRNYNDVLRDVAVGEPVFLTKNGRGRYVILDMADYEKTQATLRLMGELAEGRRSGETDGWLTLEAVEGANLSNTMEYKGCIGSVEFSEAGGVFFGKVIGIRRLLSYKGTTAKELVEDFHGVVDDYLALCSAEGKEPGGF